MLKHHLKTAFRNLSRNKLYAVVSVAGLVLGLAVCLLAARYIVFENSFDDLKDGSRIYEAVLRLKTYGGVQELAATPPHLDRDLLRRFPEIESAAYFSNFPMTARVGQKPPKRIDVCEADSNTLRMFGLHLLLGNPSTCLKDRHSVVLTKEAAIALFGEDNVIGKVVRIQTGLTTWNEFTVTALMQNLPATSSLSFTAVIPLQNNPALYGVSRAQWNTLSGCCFLKVRRDSDVKKLRSLLPAYIKSTGGDPANISLRLVPLRNVHFATAVDTHLETYNPEYLRVFAAIAILVLGVSLFNFIGIRLTTLSRRSKEAGIRKVLGASRRQLMAQHLVENGLIISVALAGAMCLSELLLPFSNSILGVRLDPDYATGGVSLLFLLVLVAIIVVFAGYYLSYFISSTGAQSLIDRKIGGFNVSGNTRKFPMLLQFVVAAFLVTCTLIGLRQLLYISRKDLGFDSRRVIVIDKTSIGVGNRAAVLTHALEEDANVLSVSRAKWFPSIGQTYLTMANAVGNRSEKVPLNVVWADQNFIKILGLKLIEGRDFNPDFGTDSNAVILNEDAARQLGNPVSIRIGLRSFPGGRISFEPNTVKVLGVVGNFNYQSLRHEVGPLAIQLVSVDWPMLALKYRKGTAKEVLAYTHQVWKKYNPDHVLQYQFLDGAINRSYLSDQRMFKAFAAGSFAAILIALTGVFALSFFLIETRTKEVAIRKILGSSVGGIVGLFSNSLLKLIVAANIVSWPVAYLVMKDWMQSFAYRADIDLLVFPAVALGMICLGFLTILYHVLKAAKADPVESLRYE